VHDQDAEFANVNTIVGAMSAFDARTKINIAKVALAEAINRNKVVARFSLMKTRQNNPAFGAASNVEPVKVADANQQAPTDGTGGANGKWKITRPTVGGSNGAVAGPVLPLANESADSA